MQSKKRLLIEKTVRLKKKIDSTEPILDKDTLAKAMNFMAGM